MTSRRLKDVEVMTSTCFTLLHALLSACRVGLKGVLDVFLFANTRQHIRKRVSHSVFISVPEMGKSSDWTASSITRPGAEWEVVSRELPRSIMESWNKAVASVRTAQVLSKIAYQERAKKDRKEGRKDPKKEERNDRTTEE